MYSVIVPTRDINPNLIYLVERVLSFKGHTIEIIILTDNHATNPFQDNKVIKLEALNGITPGEKRDYGAKIAKGEILVFLDDDSFPENDFFNALEKNFKGLQPLQVAIGGPGITPKNSSIAQMISGAFYEFNGSDSEKARYRSIEKNIRIDDWPSVNLSIKKTTFVDLGGFGTSFWPGEDTYFCNKLIQRGYQIRYCPDVIVYHHRRTTLKAHLRQIYGYGYHRGTFARNLKGNSKHVKFFLPTIFNAYLTAVVILSALLSIKFLLLLYSGVFLYIILLLAFNISVARKYGWSTLKSSTGYFFLSHIYYGHAFLKGYVNLKRFK